ncbi:MAG: hypothetical protein M3441_16320 [Chloroflexota bacterium]|nr:hypothetical protein [Chloroflexota bacterium]
MKGMNTKLTRKRSWLPAAATLVIIGITIVAAILLIPQVRPTQSMIAAVPTAKVVPTQTIALNCPSNWYDSQDKALVEACSKLKAAAIPQQQAAERATAAALPDVQTIPGFQPVTLLPPPDYATEVRELKHDPYNGAWPPGWNKATSVWQDGAVPNNRYTAWSALYVLAFPGDGAQTSSSLVTQILDGVGEDSTVSYARRWVCPQAIDAIYITSIVNPKLNITDARTPFPGLQSIVYFKTDTGQTGNFNMATEIWTFDATSKAP